LPSAVKFRPRYSHHGKVPVGLVEHVLTSSSTNILLSTLCDPSLMELEVTFIYRDKTRDKSVTNQILQRQDLQYINIVQSMPCTPMKNWQRGAKNCWRNSLDFIVYKSTVLFRATNIFQKDLSCIVGYG
jgi:hypothetical protein